MSHILQDFSKINEWEKKYKFFLIIFPIVIICTSYYFIFRFDRFLIIDDHMKPGMNLLEYGRVDFLDDSLCRGCIILHAGLENSSNPYFVHRVIGMPGDTVKFVFSSKSLIVNDTVLPKKELKVHWGNKFDYSERYVEYIDGIEYEVIYKNELSYFYREEDENLMYFSRNDCSIDSYGYYCSIPADAVFVAGDNRTINTFGMVKLNEILGRVKW